MASLWGRGALMRLDGRTGGFLISGEVTSGMLGADWTRDARPGTGASVWTAGLLLSHARGEGSYRGATGPDAEAGFRDKVSSVAGQVRFEGSRQIASNDDSASDDRLGVRLTAWR